MAAVSDSIQISIIDTFLLEEVENFICPISHEYMEDPVRIAGTQHRFDRVSIEGWFKNHNINPVTGLEVEKTLIEESDLKKMIQAFVKAKEMKRKSLSLIEKIHSLCFDTKSGSEIGLQTKRIAMMIAWNAISLHPEYFAIGTGEEPHLTEFRYSKNAQDIVIYIKKYMQDANITEGQKLLREYLSNPYQSGWSFFGMKIRSSSTKDSQSLENIIDADTRPMIEEQYHEVSFNPPTIENTFQTIEKILAGIEKHNEKVKEKIQEKAKTDKELAARFEKSKDEIKEKYERKEAEQQRKDSEEESKSAIEEVRQYILRTETRSERKEGAETRSEARTEMKEDAETRRAIEEVERFIARTEGKEIDEDMQVFQALGINLEEQLQAEDAIARRNHRRSQRIGGYQ